MNLPDIKIEGKALKKHRNFVDQRCGYSWYSTKKMMWVRCLHNRKHGQTHDHGTDSVRVENEKTVEHFWDDTNG